MIVIVTLLGILLVVGDSAPLGANLRTGTHGVALGRRTARFRVEPDVVWRSVDGELLTLDAYVPDDRSTDRPAVLLVHGGAWQGGDKRDFAPQGEAFAGLGFVAVSVNYRLAPAHPLPAAIRDVQAAVEWLRAPAQVQRYRIDPGRIGALGGSAGGHLVAMLGTLGRGPLDGDARVAAVVTWSALTDLRTIPTAGFGIALYGCASSECPATAAADSPVTHVDATDAPMLIVNATDDPITHIDQALELGARLDRAGVAHRVLLVPGSDHSTALAPAAWDETVDYLETHLAPATDAVD
jgi:acetyl esterase